MKKIIPILVVSLLVLCTTLFWFLNSDPGIPVETGHFVIILVIVGLAFYIAFDRWRSVRRGEPAHDELSKKILRMASSVSYYISIYLWLALMYIGDKYKPDIEVLIGSGILGMAVIWIAMVIFYKIRGLKNE